MFLLILYYPPDVNNHAMAYDSDHQYTVLYGGKERYSMTMETFEWDGANWTGVTTSINPGLVWMHRMAEMPSLDGIVLYGGALGYGGYVFNEKMWLYQNKTWSELHPPVTPGHRQNFGMVYDTLRNRLVLFGGIADYEPSPYYYPILSDETWEFDGNSWYQVFPEHHPPALALPSMAFDSCRNVTVLFSGEETETWHQDTWEYNGIDWIRIEPATMTPSPRIGTEFAFDSHRCRIVMHGGVKTLQPGYDETWEWDGYDWYLIEPETGRAPPYHGNSMVYDAIRKCSMMFGGGQGGYTVETLVYRHSNPDICDQMGVTLELSQTLFHTGDIFSCIAHVCNNTGDVLTGYPLLVLLDVYGTLFWAPSFSEDFDCFLDEHAYFPEGTTDVAVLPSFAWPPNAGSAQGIRFYAALTDPAIQILIGMWDMAEFGWD